MNLAMSVSIRRGDLSVEGERLLLKLRPMKGMPVASVSTGDGRHFLVVSDLHMGLTSRIGLRRPLPEEEASEICQTIMAAGKRAKADRLVILGDLKHGLFEPNPYERKALRSLSEELAGRFDVWIVKGNHDYGIEDSVDSRIRMVGKGGLELDDAVFIHGHSLPRLSDDLRSYRMIICGHIHPQMMLGGEWMPVWLFLEGRGKTSPKKVVVMPHFSKYASRAGYRPGPPAAIAPFMARLEVDSYDYSMKDLSLIDIARGKAATILSG